MPVITPAKLIGLQNSPDRVRNICILAHVDHGKTSLTDALLATNGIISPKLAGKIRYLDSRPDEQLRGITMESSAISLYFSMMRRRPIEKESAESPSPELEEHLINLIDSPGHIDFQSEVSTASRLCDGAIVLVDAVEGVCSQTVAVLRQTWIEKLRPVLVINKMDRLITELEMSPGEAYVHLSQLLENVNAVMGSFFQGERMEEDLRWREKLEERRNAAAAKAQENNISDTISQSTSTEAEYEEMDDEDIYFAPEKNNVIFSSAIDGWAFTVKQFAGIYERKLGIKRTVLEKVLWGDFYLETKTKRVLTSKQLKGRALKPMFVQLVLENIWAVYTATVGIANSKPDEGLLNKILTSLSITIPVHVLKSRNQQNILTTLFSKWLPLSTAVLVSVIEKLPSPQAAQQARMPELLGSLPGHNDISSDIRAACCSLSRDDDSPVVAFVSKMVSMKESALPRNRRTAGSSMTAEEARELARTKRAEIAKAQAAETNGTSEMTTAFSSATLNETQDEQTVVEKEDPEHLIGFARLFSGTLKVGSKIYVMPPKYSPSHPQSPPAIEVEVKALYLLMGSSLEALDTVPAGSIFGIEGLESAILKQGTLCSSPTGAPNLAGIASTQVTPIVRVALEPENPGDLDKMIKGLKMLERADPCAIYEAMDSGEHILATAGELHLERCLKDLRERFARCEIQQGEPIVPFRESITNAASISGKEAVGPRGTVVIDIGKAAIKVRIRVRPLPKLTAEFLLQHPQSLKRIIMEKKKSEDNAENSEDDVDDGAEAGDRDSGRNLTSEEYKSGLLKSLEELKGDKDFWHQSIAKVVDFGPRRSGPNVLVDQTGQLGRPVFGSAQSQSVIGNGTESVTFSIADKITYAFQLATLRGPLCHEPMQGVAVIVESVEVNLDHDTGAPDYIARLTSEAIKYIREGIRNAFLEWSPRLNLAVYRCEIQAPADSLGRVYPVLTRRHATILSEVLAESSNVYTITSLLPLHESFGFSDEIRKRTSGGATAQMVFHGFEELDEDPFWVPATEEEIEDLGDLADRENRAKMLVDKIRERKGLLVLTKKLDAEKERNMKR